MSDQHERTALVGRGERRMETARHADAVVGTILVVAPDNSGTTIGASPREFCHLTLDLRPAERTVDVKSRFESDGGAPSPREINRDPPAADSLPATKKSRIARWRSTCSQIAPTPTKSAAAIVRSKPAALRILRTEACPDIE